MQKWFDKGWKIRLFIKWRSEKWLKGYLKYDGEVLKFQK